jgi:hypothetical protein
VTAPPIPIAWVVFYLFGVFLGGRGDTCRCARAMTCLAIASTWPAFTRGRVLRAMVATSPRLRSLMAA